MRFPEVIAGYASSAEALSDESLFPLARGDTLSQKLGGN
jgi:hypothetical protein